jgi:hypothetical protein
MPIPFRDIGFDDGGVLGSAAFLKVERSADNACSLGALFVISARGEPLEFGYNRVRVPQPFLWRQTDLRRYAERRLVSSLLAVCSQQPWLLLCLASDISAELFGDDLQLEVPVARIGVRSVDIQTGEVIEDDDGQPHVAWQPGPPEEGSSARRLFDHLSAHGLLLEPFERAVVGLREVYGSTACDSGR